MQANFTRKANSDGFLGSAFERALRNARIGVVGLSGGGSHIVQALAHLGFQNYVIYDPKQMESKHLRRLVGATQDDVDKGCRKVDIAKRVILNVQPHANVVAIAQPWEQRANPLRSCDLVVGCVDSFQARHQLEILARRYRIPYFDIGMDVKRPDDGTTRMWGQVILSHPEGPCMWCMNFLRDEFLSREASEYGDAGSRPQVVWANGLLANTAIGLIIDHLTGWSGDKELAHYFVMDGNKSQVVEHPHWKHVRGTTCCHYPASNVGDPRGASLSRILNKPLAEYGVQPRSIEDN